MKARVKTRIHIKADAADVFKYLADTQYHHLWNPHLQKVKPEAQLTLGSEYEAYSLVLGVRTKAVNRVVKFVPDEEFEIENKTGMIQYCANYKLETDAKATKLTCTIAVAADSKAFAFAKPLMEHLARRELNTDLKALKQAVEQGLE